jgi:hypothetical protein
LGNYKDELLQQRLCIFLEKVLTEGNFYKLKYGSSSYNSIYSYSKRPSPLDSIANLCSGSTAVVKLIYNYLSTQGERIDEVAIQLAFKVSSGDAIALDILDDCAKNPAFSISSFSLNSAKKNQEKKDRDRFDRFRMNLDDLLYRVCTSNKLDEYNSDKIVSKLSSLGQCNILALDILNTFINSFDLFRFEYSCLEKVSVESGIYKYVCFALAAVNLPATNVETVFDSLIQINTGLNLLVRQYLDKIDTSSDEHSEHRKSYKYLELSPQEYIFIILDKAFITYLDKFNDSHELWSKLLNSYLDLMINRQQNVTRYLAKINDSYDLEYILDREKEYAFKKFDMLTSSNCLVLLSRYFDQCIADNQRCLLSPDKINEILTHHFTTFVRIVTIYNNENDDSFIAKVIQPWFEKIISRFDGFISVCMKYSKHFNSYLQLNPIISSCFEHSKHLFIGIKNSLAHQLESEPRRL